MLCYVIWLFVKRLSQEAIQRRSQRDRLVKIKVFKLRRDADDIPCNITLRSAGGESIHSAGPTTAKARFWDREVRDQGIRRSQRSAEHSGREERADCGLDTRVARWLSPKYRTLALPVSLAQIIELFKRVLSGITISIIPDKEPKYRTVRLNTGHLATLLDTDISELGPVGT